MRATKRPLKKDPREIVFYVTDHEDGNVYGPWSDRHQAHEFANEFCAPRWTITAQHPAPAASHVTLQQPRRRA